MKKQKLAALVLILPLFLSGGISVSNKSKAPENLTGGFFRSNDLGATWSKMNTIFTVGTKKATFDAASVTVMTFDPLDDSAIYLGTQHDGIFYSYDYGEGWTRTLDGKGTINDIVVDQERNCTIFVAVHNAIYKTTDCSRTWEKVYFEPAKDKYIKSLAVSYNNNSVIYAGTSGGSFLRSKDYGKSWDVIKRFSNNIRKIFVGENEESQIVYAVTQSKGIFKSLDNGDTWENLLDLRVDRAEVDEDIKFEEFLADKEEAKLKKTCKGLSKAEKKEYTEGVDDEDRKAQLLEDAQEEKNRVTCQYLTKQEKIDYEKTDKYVALKKIKSAKSVITATLDRSVEDAVIYANNGAIYRVMVDKYGPIWKQIKLLTPPNKGEAIFAVLVNPKNTDELFYATSKALYHSIDNGGSWAIDDLPTNHSARSLSFSLDNRFLYLGAYQIKKK